MSRILAPTELVLNPDGSLYHCNLLPENIADTVLLVGAPDRVPKISALFDRVEFTTQKREIVTHTGLKNGKRITVLSTGMGSDNIDIVINELDAAVNVDLKTREVKTGHKQLNFQLGYFRFFTTRYSTRQLSDRYTWPGLRRPAALLQKHRPFYAQ